MALTDVGYTWHPAYHAAVFETEAARIMGRILEARAAMEQRLLSPIKQEGTEYRELVDAQNALDVLKGDWADRIARLQN
jgi:hypothetical protein